MLVGVQVPVVIEEALANAGLEVSQVDWLLLHQANIRIMDVVADRLGLPSSKVSRSSGRQERQERLADVRVRVPCRFSHLVSRCVLARS